MFKILFIIKIWLNCLTDDHHCSYITQLKKEKTFQLILECMPTWVVPQVQNPHFRKLSNLFLGFWCKKPKKPPIYRSLDWCFKILF
jgi:hypothetical protein